jgi:PKD repeat protein
MQLRRDVRVVLVLACVSLATHALASEPCTRAWQRGLFGPDPTGWMFAAAVYDDGTGPALYGGGTFALGTGQSIARWDGTSWVEVGGGVNHVGGSYTEVHALAVYDGELIVAGDFSLAGGVRADNVARWNGTRWAPLGEGLPFIVYSLAVYEGRLVAGGMAWDGTSWAPLAPFGLNRVEAMTVYEGDLIVAGDIAPYLGKYSGGAFSTIGADGPVHALTVYDGELIAGGYFTKVAGVPTRSIARFDGARWAPVGNGTDIGLSVFALAEYEGALIVGGDFASVAGIPAALVARFNQGGSGAWSNMGTGIYRESLDNIVHDFAVLGGDLVAVGHFPAPEPTPRLLSWAHWRCSDVPNQRPLADPGGPYTSEINRGVTFDSSGTLDPDGDGLTYSWDFGDGSTWPHRPASHVYTQRGTFTVTLTAHDGELASEPATTTVTVTGASMLPIVSLVSPAEGATFVAPAAITVTASAADLDGHIAAVEFFQGTTSLGVDTTAPYSVTWTGVPAGAYALTARARDLSADVGISPPVNVVVGAGPLTPLADAFVQDGSRAARNFGASNTLEVRQSSAGNNRWTYLKFDIGSLAGVSRAKLRLFGELSGTRAASVVTAVHPAINTTWSESGLTWNNRPATGAAIASATVVNSVLPRWYEWDVTGYLQQEKAAGRHVVTLVLRNVTTSTVNDHFRSKEAGGNVPQLVITP